MIATSSAYQLSSRYPGEWEPSFTRYFAKHFPRRLSAEEAYDALAQATMTVTPFFVEGFDEPLTHAIQLPDPSEPRHDPANFFLFNFGTGDWWRKPRNTNSNVVQVLYLMNDYLPVSRTFGNSHGLGHTRVAQLTASRMDDGEAIRELFLATLGRSPDERELSLALGHRKGDREQWLSDIQWVLLNKLDFLFNY